RARWQKLGYALTLYGSMLVLYFIAFKFYLIHFIPEQGSRGRSLTLPVSAVLGKLAWFAAGPAYTAFSPFQTHGVVWLAATSVIATVYSIWVRSKKSVAEFAAKITVVIACLFLTHLPSLVAIENTLIRAEVSLSLLAAALICAALQTIADSIRVGAKAYQTVALAACLGMAVWAGGTILVTNLWPHANEIVMGER